MRFLKNFIILILLVIGFYILVTQPGFLQKKEVYTKSNVLKENVIINKIKPSIEQPKMPDDGDVLHMIDKTSDELIKLFGKPDRKDLSAYGYMWWVYTDRNNFYIQFGVGDNNKIQTIYTSGIDLSADKSTDEQMFTSKVTLEKGLSFYTFILNEEDLKERPLVKINDDLFAQYYFDVFTNKLSSIRLLTGDVLLKQRSYEIEYRGKLPDVMMLSNSEWQKVERGIEQQIHDITNVKRSQHKKKSLKWAEDVQEVAFLHSQDMAENKYFSHYGLNGHGLKERLEKKDLKYFAAGENIAAQYIDAAAAVEGWLNSEGHREALLNEEYTHLGVGVYRDYYTQNFLARLN